MKSKIVESASKNIQLYGLRKFTVDSIAIDLKISKKTIYKYFNSKDDIINEYFKEVIDGDKESTLCIINNEGSLEEKLYNIIYSYHKYKLPIKVLDEVYKFYPDQWEKVQQLKRFKIDRGNKMLQYGMEKGIIKNNININIVSKILEKSSDLFLDFNFKNHNNITIKESMKQVISVILYGILK
ncbi:TetR/AcrR family transcriptional regulator [Clostridium rectalis]|uniref:TetR/AcrR family transcriptional regulator n=1 Tax=Clostridium rectalis TaxID=2040295 RepID=UPI000F635259|nr:TetR/AcrR family transcriptional regulator [Clostridium rectalis]